MDSAAATEITTRLFEETAGTAVMRRAEALRRSILALMATLDKPYYAHPLFWAPFVVVGEGHSDLLAIRRALALLYAYLKYCNPRGYVPLAGSGVRPIAGTR